MSNRLYKIKRLVSDTLGQSIVCKACVKVENGVMIPANFGDDLNYTFLSDLFKRPISLYDYSYYANHINPYHYLFIGSIMEMLADENSIVWGAGCISADKSFVSPKKVLAVRGPLTRQRLIDSGIECPPVYGDPAMLLAKKCKGADEKKYKYGIIPHYSDLNTDFVYKLKNILPNVALIDFSCYLDYRAVIQEITSCEVILSSSLHGLIVAESYGIPNIWIKCSDNIIGGDFKFHDFFQSIDMDRESPVASQYISCEQDVSSLANSWKPGFINLDGLIQSAPFKLHF